MVFKNGIVLPFTPLKEEKDHTVQYEEGSLSSLSRVLAIHPCNFLPSSTPLHHHRLTSFLSLQERTVLSYQEEENCSCTSCFPFPPLLALNHLSSRVV